jgi:hypothetical protein
MKSLLSAGGGDLSVASISAGVTPLTCERNSFIKVGWEEFVTRPPSAIFLLLLFDSSEFIHARLCSLRVLEKI